MGIGEWMRRLDESSEPVILTVLLVAHVLVAISLGLAYRSWTPVGIVAAPFIGCTLAGLIIGRRKRSRRGS